MFGIVGFAVAAIVIGIGVCLGRWAASRAFGIRGFRRATNTGEERGRPALAFARAGAGIAGVYLACVLLFIPGFSGGKTAVDEVSMRVTVAVGGPAAEAGIASGDRVTSVNGETPRDWDHLKRLVGAHPNETIQVDVERAGEKKTFSVKTVGSKMMVGPHVTHVSLGAGEILGESFASPLGVATAFFRGLGRAIGGSEKPELSGPVGIQAEVTRAAEESTSTGMKLLAALASYQAIFVDIALLAIALVMSLLPRKSELPTGGNSS